jgi:hypothetical protein
VLYGAGVMFMSALLSLWSSAVFEELPSEGFTAALIFFGVGVVGPAALGVLDGAYGLRTAFLSAAALILLNLPIRALKKPGRGIDLDPPPGLPPPELLTC